MSGGIRRISAEVDGWVEGGQVAVGESSCWVAWVLLEIECRKGGVRQNAWRVNCCRGCSWPYQRFGAVDCRSVRRGSRCVHYSSQNSGGANFSFPLKRYVYRQSAVVSLYIDIAFECWDDQCRNEKPYGLQWGPKLLLMKMCRHLLHRNRQQLPLRDLIVSPIKPFDELLINLWFLSFVVEYYEINGLNFVYRFAHLRFRGVLSRYFFGIHFKCCCLVRFALFSKSLTKPSSGSFSTS